MPTYNYKCPECLSMHEKFYSMLDKPDRESCPECKVRMIEVYYAPVVTFNGSGFYANDKKGSK